LTCPSRLLALCAQLARSHHPEGCVHHRELVSSILAANVPRPARRGVDVKLTLKEKSILDIFHPDAMRLFIVCSDLKRVCWTLWDQRVRIDKEDQVCTFARDLPQPLPPSLKSTSSSFAHTRPRRLTFLALSSRCTRRVTPESGTAALPCEVTQSTERLTPLAALLP
jgi:hypothetical protein